MTNYKKQPLKWAEKYRVWELDNSFHLKLMRKLMANDKKQHVYTKLHRGAT